MLDDDGAQAALHDAAYRYAFRRSLSLQLASSAALEAVGSPDSTPGVGPHDPGGSADPGDPAHPRDLHDPAELADPHDPEELTDPHDPAELTDPHAPGERPCTPEADRVVVLRATRFALQRYLPTMLPPRVVGDTALKAALADLTPGDREFLLLHHWDGLTVEDAARVAGGDPGRLPAVEAACAQAARRAGPDAGEANSGDVTADHATVGDATAGPAGNGVPTAPQQEAPAPPDAALAAAPDAALAAALAAADPAPAITEDDLACSRRKLRNTGTAPSSVEEHTVAARAGTSSATATTGAAAISASAVTDSAPPVPPAAPASVPAVTAAVVEDLPAVKEDRPWLVARLGVPRRVQVALGTLCLLAVVTGLVTALIPRATPGPAGDAERLFALADVVAVVSIADLQPTQVDGELRMLQAAAVVQIVKGDAEGTTMTIDVTGRSTLERPISRHLFKPNQLVFLVRDGDGILSPIEGDESVLTLIDRRSPEATTIAGDPAPLPDELRDAIHALPSEELTLDTNGTAPGLVAEEAVLGIRPPEGADVQNHPRSPLGTFRVLPAGDGRACVVFEYNGRSVLLRWPEGYSAYERTEVLSYPNGDPRRGRQVLTVLNDRGYPYVDEQRQAPFVGGTPAGEQGECGGQELEVWDIAVEPGTTLLTY